MKKQSPLIFLSFLGLSGCARWDQSSPAPLRISEDYFVQALSGADLQNLPSVPELTTERGCLENLKKNLCVSKKVDAGFDEDCSFTAVTAKDLNGVTETLHELPPFHQKVFCHLNRLQIQDGIRSLAYATTLRDKKGQLAGNLIGLRREILENKINRHDVFTWKEQLNFGLTQASDTEMKLSPLGPRVLDWIDERPGHRLSILIHEINHLIDFMNGVNGVDFKSCWVSTVNSNWQLCPASPHSYSRLSWGDFVTILVIPENSLLTTMNQEPPKPWMQKYPLLSSLCYYWCSTTIPVARIEDVYSELYRSDFATAYSTNDEHEDFAEAAMYWTLMSQHRSFTYRIVDSVGLTLFDGERQMKSEQLRSKRQWLSDFFGRQDLKYRLSRP